LDVLWSEGIVVRGLTRPEKGDIILQGEAAGKKLQEENLSSFVYGLTQTKKKRLTDLQISTWKCQESGRKRKMPWKDSR